MHNAARWAATVYSRRQTTPVVDLSNDTLSSKHEPIKKRVVGGYVGEDKSAQRTPTR